MTREPIRFVPLTCPRCGSDLPALEEDVAFCCRPCRVAFELLGDALAAVPLLVVPHPAARTGFHLPFWQFGRVRVPAFNTSEIVPMARRFSGRSLGESPGAVETLFGGTLPSQEARQVATFAEAGGAAEVASAAAMLAVPFLDEGNRLLDAATGYVLYKENLDRAERLLDAVNP